jgi:hypothetical protein
MIIKMHIIKPNCKNQIYVIKIVITFCFFRMVFIYNTEQIEFAMEVVMTWFDHASWFFIVVGILLE